MLSTCRLLYYNVLEYILIFPPKVKKCPNPSVWEENCEYVSAYFVCNEQTVNTLERTKKIIKLNVGYCTLERTTSLRYDIQHSTLLSSVPWFLLLRVLLCLGLLFFLEDKLDVYLDWFQWDGMSNIQIKWGQVPKIIMLKVTRWLLSFGGIFVFLKKKKDFQIYFRRDASLELNRTYAEKTGVVFLICFAAADDS